MTNSWHYQSILTGEANTDLSPTDLNQLDPNDFFQVNQYVGNGTAVPTNESELRTYLNIASDVTIPEQTSIMYPVYTNIRNNTVDYRDNIYPLVNKVAVNLWSFTNDTVETLQYVLTLLKNMNSNNPDNDSQVTEVKTLLLSLIKGDPKTGLGGAEDYSNQAKVVSQKLSQFITATELDQVAVQRVHDSLADAIGSNSADMKHLQDQVNDLNKTISALTATLNTYQTVSKWILLIPLVGVIADAVLNKFTSKQREQLDSLTKQLNDANAEIQRDAALNGLLQKLTTQSGTLADQAAQALQGLSKIKGAWDTMSDSINAIVEKETPYFTDPTLNILLQAKVSAAIASWTDIKALVISFSTAAHIEPPKQLATVSLLSTGPHEDVSFPIIQMNLSS
ncbi:MAG: alpha-xenorhabdolysin family binary toxin subunit A [Bacillus sp. (in: firmicutes)]|uniref:alpha-xenorhabdolysin family binary toxin subunit A n=1 Tax=Bacillus sp. TaxID=1409 RepID=UPI0039E54444